MYCLIYNPDQGVYLEFKDPESVIQTTDVSQVMEQLSLVEQETKQHKYAVGFVTYEAAPAFDEAFVTHAPQGTLPLMAFGIFDTPVEVQQEILDRPGNFEPWLASVKSKDYCAFIEQIKDQIAEGYTYQVNYTLKLRSRFKGDSRQLFHAVQEDLKAEYAAYVELNEHTICSFSPELFFTRQGEILISKPMKGTAPRGLTLTQDKENSLWLANSKKDQAENIMIVDMIRNDLGRIAKPGSVKVIEKFAIERHPYVLQMTSAVEAQSGESIVRVFESLFPCGSITGAPKIQTMKIIKELEPQPRGVYTGAIGYIAPSGNARFSVAIRTLVINSESSTVEYGTGSGIVWDSVAENEYQECMIKSGFLHGTPTRFQLLESILWEKENGYYLLKEHLKRLSSSAEYFQCPFDILVAQARLDQFWSSISDERAKVRLLLDRKGQIFLEAESLQNVKVSDLKIGFALEPVDSQNRFLYHKTTNRAVYETAIKSRPDCDDVILWNEREEITESCRSNVVAEINGRYITPPIKCGLLAGTYRKHLLDSDIIEEGVLTKDDIKKADKVFTINSVRRWMDVKLID